MQRSISPGWPSRPACSRCSRAIGGEITDVTRIRRRRPVEDYLRPQRRFAHLFEPERRDEDIARIQARADRNVQRFGL